jgi:hypothetical protein
MAVDSASPFDIDINPLTINFDTNDKINIDTTSTINIGIAVPAIIDTIPSATEVDIARSTVIDIASPSVADLTPAAIIIDPTSSTAGAVSAVAGGFDMAFGLFNFHVDNDRVAELISVSDPTPPAAALSASPAIEGNPSRTIAADAIGGGTKPENFDPISWVERLSRSTSIPNHRLLRRVRRLSLRGCRRLFRSRDRWLRGPSRRHRSHLSDDF